MIDDRARRQLLRAGVAAGVAGLAAAGLTRLAIAGDAPAVGLQPVNIVSTSGTTNLMLASLATRMGYFSEFGLAPNFVSVGDGIKVVAALISGTMDLCPTSGFTQVLAAIEKGAPLQIIAGGAIKNFNALFSANPAVRTLQDLLGRTVGVGALGTQLHQSMIALLRKYGVDSTRVRFANIGASVDVFRAVAARVVDAGLAEIWLQDNSGLHIVEHGRLFESLPEFINQAAFASQSAITHKRALLEKTLAVYARTYRFIMSGDSQAAFLAASAALSGSANRDTALAQWRFYRESQPFAADLLLSEQQLQYMQSLNMTVGVQTSLLPYGRVADMSLARAALQRLT